jgi:hypothetical protein
MPDPTDTIIEGVLGIVEDMAFLEIVNAATTAQMEVDMFLRSQGVILSQAEIQGIITGGESTVVQNATDKLRRAITRVLADSPNAAWGMGKNAEQAQDGPEKEWTWIVESGKPCPDCGPRAGVKKTWAEWESVGLPQSGFSVCGKNCKCSLVEDTTGLPQGHLNYQRTKT